MTEIDDGVQGRERERDSNGCAAFVTTGSSFGGAEQIAVSLAGGMLARGWQAIVVHPDHPALGPLESACRKRGIDRVPVASSGSRWHRMRSLRSALRRIDPDVVNVHLGWPAAGSTAVLIGAHAPGRPLVVTEHLYIAPTRRVRVVARLLDRLVRTYVAVSDGVATGLVNDLGIDPRRVKVIKNGIDVASYRRQLVEASPIGDRRPLAVTVAQLRPQKELLTLVDAATLVPDVRFVVVGEGLERARLEVAISDAGLGARFDLIGYQPDVIPFLRAATLFVLPSRVEGLPLAVLEAMATGLPVVATDVDGTREVVVPDETGILVPPGDHVKLAAAIASVIGSPDAGASMGRRGAERVAREFTERRMLDGTRDLFDELLADARAR